MTDLKELFSFDVTDSIKIRVYRGSGLFASILDRGQEFPPDAKLELLSDGQLTEQSQALLTRVLSGDLKLEPELTNKIEIAFYQKEFSEKIKKLSESISLTHINDIEDPTLTGKFVEVVALISSNSSVMIVPTKLIAESQGANSVTPKAVKDYYAGEHSLPLELAGVGPDKKYRTFRRSFATLKNPKFSEEEFRSIYRITVRARIHTLEKTKDGRLLDENGREYKSHSIFLIADKAADFQPSTLIKVKGWMLPHPQSGKPVILADKWEFPEKIEAFDKEKLIALGKKLEQYPSVEEKVQWILSNFEKFSGIVKRRNVALLGFLVFFTPTYLEVEGDVQRGWGLGFVLGDSTTAKSETAREQIRLLKAGTYVPAEIASAVGLTGAAVQVEGGGAWQVDWGFLVLEDRRILILDGAHKLSPSNWATLAEAERHGTISIVKAAKAEAPARTRQIKIANAVDEEATRFSTKAMKDFLNSAQAITTVLDITSIARQDMAIFVKTDDVDPNEINVPRDNSFDKDLELLSEALKFAWSSSAKIKFEKDASDQILKEATRLYQKFHLDSIPLISIDMKWKIRRLAASLATMILSTQDFSETLVKKEHVDFVVKFIEQEYMSAGLHIMAAEEKNETISEDEISKLIFDIASDAFSVYSSLLHCKVLDEPEYYEEIVFKVISFIVLQGRATNDQIGQKFDLSQKSQLRPLIASLLTNRVIRQSKGFYPTARATQLVRVVGSAGFAAFAKVRKKV